MKKSMKKARPQALVGLALLLCLTLLAACGGKEATKGSISSASPSPSASEAAPSESAPAQESDTPYKPGAVGAGIYTNDFFGLACDLDENWTYCTEEEIEELNSQTAGLIKEANSEIDISEGSQYMDMYAYADDGLVTINLQVQNLGVLAGMSTTEEDLIGSEVMDVMRQTLEAVGYSDLTLDSGMVTFLGEDHAGIHLEAQLNGAPVYQQVVYVKQGSYVATVTFSSYSSDITGQLMDCFYKV